jgi:hypothetical protein
MLSDMDAQLKKAIIQQNKRLKAFRLGHFDKIPVMIPSSEAVRSKTFIAGWLKGSVERDHHSTACR